MRTIQHLLAKARFLPVKGDGMEPALRHGDFVAAMPVDDFRIDSLCVFDFGFGEIEVRRAQAWLGGILVRHDNELYRRGNEPGDVLTREQFRASVVGQVVAICNLTDRSLLEAAA